MDESINPYTDLCDLCCDWVGTNKGAPASVVASNYPELMEQVLIHFTKMDVTGADEFIQYACFGNWERMHVTRIEETLDANAWAKILVDEIFYCSDRWSWDRIIRVQWIYQRLRCMVRMMQE